MQMEGLNFRQAISKLLEILSNETVGEYSTQIFVDFNQRLEILIGFSSFIRSKLLTATTNDLQFIEEVCAIFDHLNLKYKKNMTNEALTSIIEELQQTINERLI
jgi:AAA+ ATPase superfamily predicted ATPase